MPEIIKVKIDSIIESQIPEFINSEYPLFVNFLKAYYRSQEHQSGVLDLANNLDTYKSAEIFTNENLISETKLSFDVLAFDNTFYVDSIKGWPKNNGLFKVDDEIITYESSNTQIEENTATISVGSNIAYCNNIPTTAVGKRFIIKKELKDILGNIIENPKIVEVFSDRVILSFAPISSNQILGYNSNNTYDFKIEIPQFNNCVRGFSAIDSLSSIENSQSLTFSTSSSSDHESGATVKNLSNLFLTEFFEKYKAEFLFGFEGRDFSEGISIENIILSARTFYASKGTDQSYKFLFKILYGKDIDLINPQDFTLTPSSNVYFTTKNVLVEKISGSNIENIKGKFLYQDLENSETISASIYNVESRPINGKEFYEISLDSNSFNGNFSVSGKTKILEKVLVNADTILVDSTIGFSKSGTFLVKSKNSNFIKISYEDKTVNQFLGVRGVTEELDFNLDVIEDKFVYSFTGDGNTSRVNFRLVNVINNVNTSKTSNLLVGDKIKLVGFGRNLRTRNQFNSWIYNIPTVHNILKVDRVIDKKYRVFLYDSVSFFLQEKIVIEDKDGNFYEANIIDIEYASGDILKKFSSRIVIEVPSSEFNFNKSKKLRKTITKSKHGLNYFDGIEKIPTGVQNTYVDSTEENLYVTSSGLPNYQIFAIDNKRSFNSSSIGSTDIFISPFHEFTTGELIYFSPYEEDRSGIATGYYHVNVVDENRIKLCYSQSDIFSKKYINSSVGIVSSFIIKSGYENKTLKNQKLLKKISLNSTKNEINDENQKTTNNREIGILINGVELLSPTVFDENIFYGQIDSIEITNPGKDYDAVNPPTIEIKDIQGTGAKAFPIISGNLKKVKIISPGVGYKSKPNITLVGGNGEGCLLEPNLVKTKIKNTFSARLNVNTIDNTIEFYEKVLFNDTEEVIYNSKNNANVPGLVSGSNYYVGIVTERKIKLYNNKIDSINKQNEISLTGISSGTQSIESLEDKNTITEIYVKDPGRNYSNRAVKIPSLISVDNKTVGINTFDSYIFARNHGFKTGDVVLYKTTDTNIIGLNTSFNYKVTIINENKFRLSYAGSGNNIINENFVNKSYIKFGGLGIGTHTFAYPPIQIKVESISIGSSDVISPIFDPIVTGPIVDVYIENNGVSYGCTDIINFHRRPYVGISSVKLKAVLKPIIISGSIVDVKIISKGSGYRKDSEIEIISSTGKYAELIPNIGIDGRLESINVINGGSGYIDSTTTLNLTNRGSGVQLLANVTKWKINQVIKSKNLISNIDDGILYPTKNSELGLKFVNFYVPKKLRYQIGDNYTANDLESSGNSRHSPIVGFAYDGNPIYGPYGYDTPTGGEIRIMIPGYSLIRNQNPGERPQTRPSGYFIEDHVFDGGGDLDRNNGRFCITPEYPNGVYAYFQTINVDSSRRSSPRFPYIIGESFKDSPIEENFKPGFNQDNDIFNTSLSRNISPYYSNFANSSYDLFEKIQDDLKQEFRVDEVESNSIDPNFVISEGDNYKVNDLLILNTTQSKGSSANIVISELKGRKINNFTLLSDRITDVNFVINNYYNVTGKTSNPHELKDGEFILISGISTITSSQVEGIRKIKVKNNVTKLSTSLDTISNTGLSTHIYVNSINGFFVNDFISIENEKFQILDINKKNSALFVNRLTNTSAHGIGATVNLLPTKFNFDINSELNDITIENKVLFFNPKESVGTGTTGISRTVVGFANTDLESRFIPQRRIYIPNHNLKTGQKLIYNCGIGGTSLVVNNVGSAVSFKLDSPQTVYAVNFGKDYVGISTIGFTSTSGIGTTLNSLEFRSIDDVYDSIGAGHSLSTTNAIISGTVDRVTGIITTANSHDLLDEDIVNLSVSPKNIEIIKVVYDFVNRKSLLNEFLFNNSKVNIETSEIDISEFSYDIPTGSKVVYISNNSIDGLTSYNVYFALQTSDKKIKLCETLSDIKISNNIKFTSSGGLNQRIYFISPPLTINKGNLLRFDLSDQSLLEMDLNFYLDDNFDKKVEVIGNVDIGFSITREGLPGTPGAIVEIDTSNKLLPSTIYYSLIPKNTSDQTKRQISIDDTIIGRNKIIVVDHPLNSNYEIQVLSDDEFSFVVDKKLSFIDKINLDKNIFEYTTQSKNAKGPISNLKINFAGRGFQKLPFVSEIKSEKGKNGVVKIFSNKIGKIKSLERVKDGFDYPTDPTLSPILSVPTVVAIKNIRTIDYIKIIDGGSRYNTSPDLIVKGSNEIQLVSSISSGGSVVDVSIKKNSTQLSGPLEIIPIRNSNGYEIDFISVNGSSVTLELLNTSFMSIGYGNTSVKYPFKVGDKIFIENCRLTNFTSARSNFNSSSYGYQYFTLTDVNENNNTITYSMVGIATGTFGTYDTTLNFGTVVNVNDLASFEMILKDDVDYQSKEKVYANNFSGTVMENGWDRNLNLLRLTDSVGTLSVGDILFGEKSKVKGTVEFVDSFYLNSTLGVSREKSGSMDLSSGILNESQQKISDNFYYQKFAYSIKSEIPYDTWKESVRSTIHPAGFKEFSDLSLFSEPSIELVNVGISKSTNLRAKLNTGKTSTLINIDGESSMYRRNNFATVYEEELLPDGSVEDIYIFEGTPLLPFIVNKTNKVLLIDDISNEFDGTSLQTIEPKYLAASDILKLNVNFIEEEVVGFATATYPQLLSNNSWDRDNFKVGVGSIVNSIAHDLKYESNDKTVEHGLSYWDGVINSVDGKIDETIGAFNYIVDLSKYIVNNVGVKTTYQKGTPIAVYDFSYDNITGFATVITSTPHGFSTITSQIISLKDLLLTYDTGISIETISFPQISTGNDGILSPQGYIYNIQGIGSTTFRFNLGISSVVPTYNSGGIVQKAFISTSQYLSNNFVQDPNCQTINENCYEDISELIDNYVGIITSIIVEDPSSAPTIIYPSITRGGSIVGLTSFKLKSNTKPLFKVEFDSTSTSFVDLNENKFIINNHNLQSGQELIYDFGNNNPIGIATTSFVSGDKDILMKVGSFNGSALYENGYNVSITTAITGTSVNIGVGQTSRFYTNVIGTNASVGIATFNVFITYNSSTGQPISTSIILKEGGRGFSVGDTVTIAGTNLSGTTPANNLSFVVSSTGVTKIPSETNELYLSIPSTDGKSLFDVQRDSDGFVSGITVINGGFGYDSTSIVSIAGTYIGGNTSLDNVSFTPTELGSNKISNTVYVNKLNDNEFRISGVYTGTVFDLTSFGTGIQTFTYKNPNSSVLITIDGIIQSPLTDKNLIVSLGSTISTASTTVIEVSSGISSLSFGDIIKIDNEYLVVKNIGAASSISVDVMRGALGSKAESHGIASTSFILSGDFNIVEDVIYFTTAPYGKIGPVGLKTGSSFSGRLFSRSIIGSEPNDKNIILDDISLSFTGIAATEFLLKSNRETTQVLFNDLNYGVQINNNPFILINNILQVPNKDYFIDSSLENTIKFISGVPKGGRITKVGVQTGFGYIPLRGASAVPIVSGLGTISNIILTGAGSGYRTAPPISIGSTIGYGASVVATIGVGGTITGFTIVNPGTGYTTSANTVVNIGIPTGYSNLGVAYTGGTFGVGQGAKVSVSVGQGSSIISFKIDNPGIGYKVGDILKVRDLLTRNIPEFEEFRLTVLEIENDKFSGFFPGQCLLLDDISTLFDGSRRKFTIKVNLTGTSEVLTLKTLIGSDLNVDNNIFVFINDILQVPGYSYTIQGSRIFFTEPPKKDSICTILYYRGSSNDVEFINPPKFIKDGDRVTIKSRFDSLLDQKQFERTIKTIASPDTIKTFPYGSIGIVTDNTFYRPADYKKQLNDRVINGQLISKSRPTLTSNLKPTANLITKLSTTDLAVYVDNAFPIFTEIDKINENLRDIDVIEYKEIDSAVAITTVSVASTISDVTVIYGGVGYAYTLSPKVTFSQSKIVKKDPIYNWNYSVGISQNYEINSIAHEKLFVAVGEESSLVTSLDGIDWNSSNVGFGTTVGLRSITSVGLGTTSLFVAVGTGGPKVIKSVGYSNSITSWEQIKLYDEIIIPTLGVTGRRDTYYTGILNDIVYSPSYNTFVTVGTGGSIFVGSGLTTDSFVSKFSQTLSDLTSIAFEKNVPVNSGYFLAVGSNGTILSSSNGQIWDVEPTPVITKFNKIIYADKKFVIIGDNGTVVTSSVRGSYNKLDTNIITDLINIDFLEEGIWVVLDSAYNLYYSFDLSTWINRETPQLNNFKDLTFVKNLGSNGRYVFIGSAGTSMYSEPIYHRAEGYALVNSGVVTSVVITDGGFGYDLLDKPPVIIEQDLFKKETIVSIKVKGDYGTIIGITTFLAGTPGIGTTTPKIEFVLKSETYDNSNLGIGYSSLNSFGVNAPQLEKGDYFVITDSNVTVGHDLVGITTLLGGMSNYPNSKVGISTLFLDGVYRVEDVTDPILGIVTVTCNFAPRDPTVNEIQVYIRGENRSGINTHNFYGRYSWGKIYDFQNRLNSFPENFDVNVDNGIVGIKNGPIVTRTRPILTE
jgi:hypothetical protein